MAYILIWHLNIFSIIYCINKIREKNDVIISIDVEKAFDNIEYPFIIEILFKAGKEELPQLLKGYL